MSDGQTCSITLDHAYGAIDILDWCERHRVPWNESGRCWSNVPLDGECRKVRVVLVAVDPTILEKVEG